eukprot:maker-scaffold137_size321222-snap-gene-0.9 protein:Tk01552 transcript:maker-scaffold137_size321222-snap-gene-0.9-mRNA-1 annotation:"Nicalin-1"
MKEFPDYVLDLCSPYYLLVFLPVMILISPIDPCVMAHEFPVARGAHFELGGHLVGTKIGPVNLEAKSLGATHVLRKLVVAAMADVPVSTVNDLVTAGVGGLLLTVPMVNQSLKAADRERIVALEDHILSHDFEIPLYFTSETQALRELTTDLKDETGGDSAEARQEKSGAQTLLEGIVSNGYQFVASSTNPKMLTDQNMVSIQGYLAGRTEPETLPTIVVVAHYDAGGAAPSMAFGADSNGSGVSILMELARIFGELYKSPETQPDYNLVFLLSAGGKTNFLGSKRWLDEQKDMQDQQRPDIITNVKLVVCLDSLGLGDDLYVHVSKPPKEGTSAHKFLHDLKTATKMGHLKASAVDLIHKKINLAYETLAWEHERFSIAKLSALTLSHHKTPFNPEKSSMLDREISPDVLRRNTLLLAETLACTMYKREAPNCLPKDVKSQEEHLAKWTQEMASAPRGTPLMVGDKNPLVQNLLKSLDQLVMKTRKVVIKRDKRDPEYTFYDNHDATMNSYKVKPAVFDLVLTVAIAAYLGLVYLVLSSSGAIYSVLASLATPKKTKTETHGSPNGKAKAH